MKVTELIQVLTEEVEKGTIEAEAQIITGGGQPITSIEVVKDDLYISEDYQTVGTKEDLTNAGKLAGMTKLHDKGTVVIF